MKNHNLFQKIYEENYLRMYHVAFGILKNQADAENAVSEAFLSIAENHKKYFKISGSKIPGLCVTIVKHKSIDILRRQKHWSEEEVENLVLYQTDPDYEPEGRLERIEQGKLVQRLLSQMPETLRAVLELKYFYDYSDREIAKCLGISVKAVQMRVYRAKQKMKGLLENEEP